MYHRHRFVGLCCAALALASTPALANTPDDGWIVWLSNRLDGRHEVYLKKASGGDVVRLTTAGTSLPGLTKPSWSPDGRWISYLNAADNAAHVIRWDGTEDKKVCSGSPLFWLHDNSGLVCQIQDTAVVVDPDVGGQTTLFSKSDFSHLSDHTLFPGGISLDRRWLVAHTNLYYQGYTGSNGTFKTQGSYLAAVALDLLDRDKVYFIGSGCQPTTAPLGDLIYHVCAESVDHPDIYSFSLSDATSRSSYSPEVAFPDTGWGHEYCPRVSTDNRWLTYGATTGCHDQGLCDYEIFVHQLGQSTSGPSYDRTRITTHAANDHCPHMYVGDLWSNNNPPRPRVEPEKLDFVVRPGSELSPQQRERLVLIWNLGGGLLKPLTAAVSYAEPGRWLNAVTTGTGNQQMILVSVNASAGRLRPGQHHASIRLTSNDLVDGAQALDVDLTVVAPEVHAPNNKEPPETLDSGGCVLNRHNPPTGHLPVMLVLLVWLQMIWWRR